MATAGDHSPFAKSLLKNFDEHPRLFLRDVLELTAKDARLASRGVQVPEITTRGGSPKVCLDAAGCGEPALSLPAESALNDQGVLSEARASLQQLGFITDKSRGGGAARCLAGRRDQALPGQGRVDARRRDHAEPLAVLRATKTQVAAFR